MHKHPKSNLAGLSMIKLDIISDPVCPWCYIGKTELDSAMAERPNHPFTIEWHPYQLNPAMPAEGMDRKDYLEHKFGGRDGALRAYAPILERAEALGLAIDFAAITRQPNTLNAHRLIHWAGLEGRQQAVVAAVFRSYFNDGGDIGSIAELRKIGEACGMDHGMLERLFSADADLDAMRARDTHARERGVTGAPCFIISNEHVLQGAQPKALWIQVIDELIENMKDNID